MDWQSFAKAQALIMIALFAVMTPHTWRAVHASVSFVGRAGEAIEAKFRNEREIPQETGANATLAAYASTTAEAAVATSAGQGAPAADSALAPAVVVNKAAIRKPVIRQPGPAAKPLTEDDIRYMEAAKRAIRPKGSRPAPINGIPVLYPELLPICACESSYEGQWWDTPRHYENGEVIRNYDGNDDVGMCQINLTVHGEKAEMLGYDLATVAGNINYTNWLFEQEGSAPWFKSEHCWRKAFRDRS